MGDKYTIYIHCWKIYNLFVWALETSRKASFSSLFRSVCKLILYFPTMYMYCIFLVCLNGLYYKSFYHIFCCNMFIFGSPIIAKSQVLVICPQEICPQVSVFALIYPYLPLYSTSGICAVVSKIICQSTSKDAFSIQSCRSRYAPYISVNAHFTRFL